MAGSLNILQKSAPSLPNEPINTDALEPAENKLGSALSTPSLQIQNASQQRPNYSEFTKEDWISLNPSLYPGGAKTQSTQIARADVAGQPTNTQIARTNSGVSSVTAGKASEKNIGISCPANITLDNGKVLAYAGEVNLAKGTAHLFVDGDRPIGKGEVRQVYLYAGERVFPLGKFSGQNIEEMNSYARGQAARGAPIAGDTNLFNGAGGLHNEILKQADSANFAMAVKLNALGPQIRVPLQTNSLVPGETQAIAQTALMLGLGMEPGKNTMLIPNNSFGGGAFVAMYEASLKNSRDQGLSVKSSTIRELVPGATAAFYKGAEDAYGQIKIGNYLKLGEAVLGVLGASKAGALRFQNARRVAKGLPKANPSQVIPGGFAKITRTVDRIRVRNEQRVQQRQKTVQNSPGSTPQNPVSNKPREAKQRGRAHANDRNNTGNQKAGSISGVDPRNTGNGNAPSNRDIPENTKAPRRSREQRILDISDRVQKDRFNGKNITVQFTEDIPKDVGYDTVVTPAKDSDRLMNNSPVTIGDVKQMLGGLSNSSITIERLGDKPSFQITIKSDGFSRIALSLKLSQKGITGITIGEISTTKPAPQRDATKPRALLLGAILGLKIVQFAESKKIDKVEALAIVTKERPGSPYISYQGAQFWLNAGLDGPIGLKGASKIREFIRTLPEGKSWVDPKSVTENTRILDLLTDAKGNLVPEYVKYWRESAFSYQGSIDLKNKKSKSYLLYQHALKESGLK